MKSFALASLALLVLARPGPAFAQACRAVPHPQLEALLPVMQGFTRGTPKGETPNGEAVSRTTVDYEDRTGGAAVISVELMDSCRNPAMLSQIREFLKTVRRRHAGRCFAQYPFVGSPRMKSGRPSHNIPRSTSSSRIASS